MYRTRIAFAGAAIAVALMFGNALAADRDLAAKVSGLLAKLSATPDDARLTAEAAKHAQLALKNAQQTRAQGDTSNAALLEDTALEWAQLGNDLLVAHRQETSAREAERALMDTTNQLRRAEAFLEETEARRGRALAQLNHPEEVPVPPSPAASPKAGAVTPAVTPAAQQKAE